MRIFWLVGLLALAVAALFYHQRFNDVGYLILHKADDEQYQEFSSVDQLHIAHPILAQQEFSFDNRTGSSFEGYYIHIEVDSSFSRKGNVYVYEFENQGSSDVCLRSKLFPRLFGRIEIALKPKQKTYFVIKSADEPQRQPGLLRMYRGCNPFAVSASSAITIVFLTL